MAIQVNIVSAEGAIFEGDADMVFAPAKLGEIGIAPLCTRTDPALRSVRSGACRAAAARSCST